MLARLDEINNVLKATIQIATHSNPKKRESLEVSLLMFLKPKTLSSTK